MEKYIKRISGVIPNTHKEININLEGKNLILTGTNGSGKTSLLRDIFRKVNLLIVQRQMNLSQLKLEISQSIDFSKKYNDKIAIILLFEATRIAKIVHANTAKGLATEQQVANRDNQDDNLGNNLEQHLVNLRNRKSLAITEDNDTVLAEKINAWFIHFEKNLKFLMEDESTKLHFDSNSLKFSIHQDGKPPYTFQTLSSGYLAIFDVYADLLMRTEYFKITPDELSGTAFIDEIDAHLHVSLQRIIFKFFTDSFPNVQFIVTTHSPFVLMSVDNAVIFDVSRNEQVDENLSLYSYSAVVEGLLGTKTTSPLLNDLILEISHSVNTKKRDYLKLQALIDKLRPIENKLDSRSKAYYLRGVNALLDME